MPRPQALILVTLLALANVSSTLRAQDARSSDKGSKPRPAAPAGRVDGPFEWKSQIFPGTVRNYWVYVPSAYDAAKPACVMVVQDGLGRAKGWRLPEVFDELIQAGEMPVTIGVFIDHGKVLAPHDEAEHRYNRSFEYDALGDRYARFLLEEMLPEVSKSYALSDDPNDRAIAGASSGAICAFTVAWERPDAFRRVFSTIGTYVGLRGGNEYPTRVRKTEPKPIRIFLQDGSNDLNIYGGDWWIANQSMLSALRFSGYDVRHDWGTGGHDGKHGAAIFPDAMRWLWRDHPQPIRVGKGQPRRTQVLVDGEDWQLVSQGHGQALHPTTGPGGRVLFCDPARGEILVAEESNARVVRSDVPGVDAITWTANGQLFASRSSERRMTRLQRDGPEETVWRDAAGCSLLPLPQGGYLIDAAAKALVRVSDDGLLETEDTLRSPRAVVCSADQTLIFVAEDDGRFVWSYARRPDGTLTAKQEFGWLHMPDDGLGAGARSACVDTSGRLWIATRLGVQILDQLGRVHLILPAPPGERFTGLAFGGERLDTLYATSGGKLYRRKFAVTGVVPSRGPVRPPKPGL